MTNVNEQARAEVAGIFNGKVIAGTGHRPNKLGGYTAEVLRRLDTVAEKLLRELQPTKVLSGMAQGWDIALARAAVKLGIPYVAVVPFKGHHILWPQKSRDEYDALLAKASEIVIVSNGPLPNYDAIRVAMQKRNEWLVDNSECMLALYNGDKKGGTFNCLEYLRTNKAPVGLWYNAWNDFLTTK